MSVGIVFDAAGGWRRFQRKMRQLELTDMNHMLDLIGSEVESQTRHRISEEKKAPDGTDWSPWSPRYAASQHGARQGHHPHPGQLIAAGSHTILELDGHLLDSIEHQVEGDEVLVGSNMVYAATHQYGRGPIPAREFLGLSDQNAEDIEELVADFLEATLVGGRSI